MKVQKTLYVLNDSTRSAPPDAGTRTGGKAKKTTSSSVAGEGFWKGIHTALLLM